MKRTTGPPILPVLASQCHSRGEDIGLDSRHGTSGSREPLKESTGNAQHHSNLTHPLVQRFDQQQHVYPIPPLSTPALYLGPALDFNFGDAQYARSLLQQAQFQQHQQQHQQQLTQGGRKRLRMNPFWQSPEFQAYRKRQAERDDKGNQIWPECLEEAFLDAFLVIPQIRKMKYSLRGKLNGRNMLIGEYIWLDYVANLPPGVQPDPAMRRERKQVSSHIQVLKNFLKNHPWFHIFFPIYEPKSKGRDLESQEKESFKNHPVLIALTEQRLPDEQLNYDYFAQILSMKNAIAIKPKKCWIFVSHRDVSVQEDGSGYLATTGDRLPKAEYPHLKLNLEREKWAKDEQQQICKGALLHEFTKDLTQFEASTIREITDEWEDTCPELHEKLEDIIATNPRCDILHMHSTLELKEKRRFPGQSDLNSWVEVHIEQPHLLNHRWKVETALTRPPELSYSSDKSVPETVYRTSARIGFQYQHRPGCEGPRGSGGEPGCDGRCRKDSVIVPFPADVFALTLTNCAEYPAHPPIEVIRRRFKRSPVIKGDDSDLDQSFKAVASNSGDQPTQMDLVPRIAMMQELWSCPPGDSTDLCGDSQRAGGDNAKKGPRWERRGLILWTFQTIHSIELPKVKDRSPQLKTAPNGKTQWRFLQILDAASQYHQSRVLVRGDGSGVGSYRDGGGQSGRKGSFDPSIKHGSRPASPSTTAYPPQPHSASTAGCFSAAGWDVAHRGSLSSLSSSATQGRAQAAYNNQVMLQTSHAGGLLDNFGGGPAGTGLATPPPSASLASSFATSFESIPNDATADQLTNYIAAHVTSASEIAHSQQSLSELAAVTDPFLANAAASGFDVPGPFDGASAAHDDVPAWATSEDTVPGTNHGDWPTEYYTASATNGSHHHHSHGARAVHWMHESPSASAGPSNMNRHYGQQHTSTHAQPPQLHLQTQGNHHRHGHPHHPHNWVTGASDPEDTGFWTPATSADEALSSGIDAREQAIWPVSVPGIPDTPHDPRYSNGDGNSGSDDWVHIVQQQQQSAVVVASLLEQQQEEGGEEEGCLSASASTSDLSQDWEEIVAASESQQSQQFQSQSIIATTTSADGELLTSSFPLSPLTPAASHLHEMSTAGSSCFTRAQQHQHRGQKRSRSDSRTGYEFGGSTGDSERMDEYHQGQLQHLQHLHRSSQRARLSPI